MAEPPRIAAELAALLRRVVPPWTISTHHNGVMVARSATENAAYYEPDGIIGRQMADLPLQLAECRRERAETGDGPELSEDDAARTLR